MDKRLGFGNVAMKLVAYRTAILSNVGAYNAMFYVANSNPIPNMSIEPVHGIIPVGGSTELKVSLVLVKKNLFWLLMFVFDTFYSFDFLSTMNL